MIFSAKINLTYLVPTILLLIAEAITNIKYNNIGKILKYN